MKNNYKRRLAERRGRMVQQTLEYIDRTIRQLDRERRIYPHARILDILIHEWLPQIPGCQSVAVDLRRAMAKDISTERTRTPTYRRSDS